MDEAFLNLDRLLSLKTVLYPVIRTRHGCFSTLILSGSVPNGIFIVLLKSGKSASSLSGELSPMIRILFWSIMILMSSGWKRGVWISRTKSGAVRGLDSSFDSGKKNRPQITVDLHIYILSSYNYMKFEI